MDKTYYRDKLVLEQHLNTDAYIEIEANTDKAVFKSLNQLMEKHKSCLTSKEFTYITNYEWKSSNLYVMPKVHKCKSMIEKMENNDTIFLTMNPPSDLQARPIIAGPVSPTQHLSELLEKILSPIVTQLRSYIKDDWDFIRKLPNRIDYDCEMYSCDVISLYTSITHELGEKALNYFIDRKRNLIPSRFTKEFIIESALFVLKNNNFFFDRKMYHQLIGAAMGTIFAPPYACLSVGFLEETELYPQLQIHINPPYYDFLLDMFKRYIDDGIIPWPRELDIQIFEAVLNNLDPKIKFTLERSVMYPTKNGNAQKLNYLDISVILYESGLIETDIHYKDTNTHDYLNYHSHHPQHIKDNIPFNLAKRIIVFCSNPEVETMRLSQLRDWLIKCDYPEDVISKSFHNAKLQGPAPKPTNAKNTLPLVTTYFSNYDCTHMSNRSEKLLNTSQSARVKHVFSDTRTVLALRQPPNILRQLCQAKFVSNSHHEQEYGLSKCSSKKCILCRDYIQPCRSFLTASNVEWHINCHITCNSRNVIYFIKCLCCNLKTSYIGRTNHFRFRMNQHISESRTGNTSNIFDKHVYKCKQNSIRCEPYFQILAFIQLKEAYQLPAYEKHFHALKYDTMN